VNADAAAPFFLPLSTRRRQARTAGRRRETFALDPVTFVNFIRKTP
jgi:hypothetical protein